MSVQRARHRRQPRPRPRARRASWPRRARASSLVARESDELDDGGRGDPRRAAANAHALAADVGDKDADPRHRRRGGGAGRADRSARPQRAARSGRRRCGCCSTPSARTSSACSQVNLVGPFRLTKAIAGAHGAARRAARSCTSASDAAVERVPALGRVRRVEGGARAPGRIWAAELAGTGVRVLAVDPGRDGHARCTPTRSPTPIARRWPSPAERRASAPAFESSNGGSNGARVSRAVRVRAASAPRARDRAAPAAARSASGAVGDAQLDDLPSLLRRGRPARRQRRGHPAGVAAGARADGRGGRGAPRARARRRRAGRRCCSAPATGARRPSVAPPPRAARGRVARSRSARAGRDGDRAFLDLASPG